MSKTKKPLGRGLSALLGEADSGYKDLDPVRFGQSLPISALQPGQYQPRQHFAEDELKELAASIKQNGILQPLLVRSLENDKYEIIAGERRWRAARQAGLSDVPCVVKHLTNREALELALIENIQRQDLTPLEEARGYKQLIAEFAYTQNDLAKQLGKSRSHIANVMRLLQLPQDVRELLETGKLSSGHARALLNADDPSARAQQVMAENLTVRELEGALKQVSDKPQLQKATRQRKSTSGNSDIDMAGLKDMQQALSDALQTPVQAITEGQGGRFILRFNNANEALQIVERATTGNRQKGEPRIRAL